MSIHSNQDRRGDQMTLSYILEDMAEEFLKLLIQLDNETKFMMFEPGERTITVEQLKTMLSNSNNSNGVFVGVYENDELVGFISANRGIRNRIKHTAYIVIGILQNYTGKGYGRKLIEEVEKWALKWEVNRLELLVMTHNERAINLYEKMGFYKEGIKKKSMLVDGKYIDEYYMAKLI
jgi:RimJ/RimL family protein N-acetyltransferase